MTYRIALAASARKALRKLSRSGSFDRGSLDTLLVLFETGVSLPTHYKDHGLHGAFSGSRECHLAFDLLVLYKRDDALCTVTIQDIGTHEELFGG